jgi:hypothetical protein
MRVLLPILIVLTACKSSPPADVDAAIKLHPKVAAKIEAMKKIIVNPLPAVTKDEMHPDGQVVWFNPRPPSGKPSGNALTLGASTVGSFSSEAYGTVKMDAELNECASILEKKKMADGREATGFWADEAFKVCEMIRYVFVVEEGTVKKPVLSGTKSFTPGLYEAKVHGYDLEKGVYFGSARVSATTNDEVTNYRGEAYASDAVDGMFLSTAFSGIKVALKKAIPTIDLN